MANRSYSPRRFGRRLRDIALAVLPGRHARGRVRAVLDGAVLADSDDAVVIEGNHYFPPGAVARETLRESSRHTVCPWKGLASYYDVEAGGRRLRAAAWTYRHPSPLARRIKDHVAFSPDEVRIERG